jgi:magnesium chelatase family protein
MTLARSWSVALVGLKGVVVEVEADLAAGIPGLAITGLPDASLTEARDRVKAAVVNSGVAWPSKRITLGLSPAALPKRGSHFDLALAAAVVCAGNEQMAARLRGLLLIGELGLDGRVRPVTGVLPALLEASKAGFRHALVPAANLAEARLVEEVDTAGVATLRDVVTFLQGGALPPVEPPRPTARTTDDVQPDFLDVVGQPLGRLACEVVAAGGHNLLFTGPPGCGKTLLAERLPGLLPALSRAESLEVSAIHSVAGVLPGDHPLVERPPFQAPHHGATTMAVVGGGSGLAKPGAASLAHRGVLFLDEAPEFARGVLDALRQPLESGEIVIRRVGGTARYPARFSLVLAANPCPCAKPERHCTCRPAQRQGYLAKLSGPLLDRVDVQLRLPAITRREMQDDRAGVEATAVLRARVAAARERALARYAGTPWRTNADVPAVELVRRWPVDRSALKDLAAALDKGQLTARGYDRVQRVAWTLADLAGRERPTVEDVNAAHTLRMGDPAVGGLAA